MVSNVDQTWCRFPVGTIPEPLPVFLLLHAMYTFSDPFVAVKTEDLVPFVKDCGTAIQRFLLHFRHCIMLCMCRGLTPSKPYLKCIHKGQCGACVMLNCKVAKWKSTVQAHTTLLVVISYSKPSTTTDRMAHTHGANAPTAHMAPPICLCSVTMNQML